MFAVFRKAISNLCVSVMCPIHLIHPFIWQSRFCRNYGIVLELEFSALGKQCVLSQWTHSRGRDVVRRVKDNSYAVLNANFT